MALHGDRWISCDDQAITIRGSRIRPFLTPDDIDAVAQIIHHKTGVAISPQESGQII